MAGQCQAVRRGLRPVLPKLFTLILGVYALSFWKERKERNYGDSWKSTFGELRGIHYVWVVYISLCVDI
eukprot:1356625-Amorphochlora_amoeboformis.AAC.2